MLSLVVLVLLLLLPSIILHILGSPRDRLSDPGYKDKYGEVYEHTYRTKKYTRGLFYPLFLLHRYVFIFTVFALSVFGLVQVSLMIIATFVFLFYLFKLKPFKGKLDHLLNIVATIILLILYLTCLCFGCLDPTRYSRVRNYLGFTFIALALFLFFFCVIAIVIFQLANCCKKYKEKKQGKK